METYLRMLNNAALWFVFILLAPYLFYTIFGLFIRKKKFSSAKVFHHYAVLIAARNEEKVIDRLITSIKTQKYQGEIDVFVIADNCTDQTANVARKAGATVIERSNLTKVGKGYALHELIHHVTQIPNYQPSALLFFDADNLLHPDYFENINKVYDSGETIICSYRNAKNFGASWVSSSSALIFLREAKFLHQPRYALKTSTHVSGTGFLVKREYLEKEGWDYYLLTEDIEFTINQIIRGRSVAYCADAIFYDEQPINFKDSWNQRLRWIKGGLQCLASYWKILTVKLFQKRQWAIFEILYWVSPLPYIAISASLALSIAKFIYVLIRLPFNVNTLWIASQYFIEWMVVVYIVSWIIAFLVIITEYKNIKASFMRKVWSIFVFPLFIFTFLPIVYIALFSKNVLWHPIPHTDNADIDQLL